MNTHDQARVLLERLAVPVPQPRDEDLTAREVWADLVEVEALAMDLLTELLAGSADPGGADELEDACTGRDTWEARWPDRADLIDDCLDLLRRG